MEAAVTAGLSLCRILIVPARTDILDERTLEQVQLALARAVTDSHQLRYLPYCRLSDISHATFYRAHELLSKLANSQMA